MREIQAVLYACLPLKSACAYFYRIMTKKTTVITGAGSGIGRAAAIALSAHPDVHLLLIGRREEQLKETLALLARPEQHMLAPMDVRDGNAWKVALQRCDVSALHAVFANAGIGGENHYGTGDRWEEIIGVNLTGTYVTIMECLPHLLASPHPFRHVLITSSCLARFGVPNYTAYCTAKTGLLGLTRSLAVQYASQHVLVNALCPGWVETDMAKAGIQKLADHAATSYEISFKEQMGFVPTGRMSQPQEIAQTVKFFFSDLQTSMTGQGIDINNGSFMQ
jgi:NAD(P)-dependent dehydrogenase (short-subunit alcohol dehydrogenase family)